MSDTRGAKFTRRGFVRLAATAGAAAALSPALGAWTPQAAKAAASLAEGENWASGVTVRYFVGGAAGDTYGSIKLRGAQQAATDLGCNGEYLFAGWDQAQIAQQMREAIAVKPDGIALCWLGSDEDLMPLAQQCYDAGIILDLQNVDYPKVRAAFQNGYTGVFDLKGQGEALGKEALRTMDLKPEDHALVLGAWTQPNRFWREEGTALAFEEAGMKVTRINAPPTWAADPNQGTPDITAAVLADPAIKIIVFPGGQLLGAAGLYMEACGKAPGEIYCIGFDTSAAVMDAFDKSWVQLSSDQQPWQQGYMPMLSICIQKKLKMAPLLIETGTGFVNTSNYKDIAELATAGIR
jgi:simple sugar transport system substrate-binding protein